MAHLSEEMRQYRALEEDLRLVRTEKGLGSPQEDPLLEEMARLWWLLSDIEREILDQEGPTCDPVEMNEDDDLHLVDKNDAKGPLRARLG
ncbi:MAG TPA: hypothetical protein VFK02_06330 [Kofleriaceae bacterium]|nr:hypothetical protein [Kofleriaceae bacterium]